MMRTYILNNKVFFTLILLLSLNFSHLFSQSKFKVPDWYEHKEVVYPSEFYISAIGEGITKEEAEIKAVSQISLFFNTTTQVVNDLIKTYSEVDDDKNYHFSQSTKITERSKINSSAEFFGVQFDTCFYLDGKYYSFRNW